MFELISKPKSLQPTKVLIDEFVNMTKVPGERPLSDRRMTVYQKILNERMFRPVTWASAYCEETDEVYRVNGQHTSLLLSRQPKIPEFCVVLERYTCKTMKDIGRLYGTFDSKTASRSVRDINMAFASAIPEMAEISSPYIALGISASSFQRWGTNFQSIPAIDRAEQLFDCSAFVTWMHTLVNGHRRSSKHLMRGAVAAAMYSMYLKASTKATEFWTLVRDESAPDNKNASRTLAKYLSQAVVGVSHSAKDAKKRASFREMYCKCIHGWNAWRKNETTALQYYPKADLPKAA